MYSLSIVSMSDTDISRMLAVAESYLDSADESFSEGDEEGALRFLEKAIDDLFFTGSKILSHISDEDITHLDGSFSRILRGLAEKFGLLPEDYTQVFAVAPEALDVLDDEALRVAKEHATVKEMSEILKNLYGSDTSPLLVDTEEKERAYTSSVGTLIELIRGQRTVSDAVFSVGGPYDSLSDAAAPYLITGSAFISGDEDTEGFEKRVPKILNGPVKRLFMLLTALLTSAFMSGILLLLIKRLLATRSGRPGVMDDVVFAGSVARLTMSNVPMFIAGARAVASEFQSFWEIVSAEKDEVDILVQ